MDCSLIKLNGQELSPREAGDEGLTESIQTDVNLDQTASCVQTSDQIHSQRISTDQNEELSTNVPILHTGDHPSEATDLIQNQTPVMTETADTQIIGTSNIEDQEMEINLVLECQPEINKSPSFSPVLLSSLYMEKDNYFKGCKWSPDGLCIMTNSADNIIRLINTPAEIVAKKWDTTECELIDINVCLKLQESGTIYDYAWWPLMNSLYPSTCCLATTASDQPIHLWDAFNGSLRATYIAKDQVDEVKAAHCIGFSSDGMQMICGFKKELRLFYIDKPGDTCEVWPTVKPKCSSGQRGIISAAEFSPDDSTIACGSYDGTTALYSSKNGNMITKLSCGRGVTQVRYTKDGNRLYAGLRKSDELLCWDVRYLRGNLFKVDRKVDTNQRIYFDLTSRTFQNKEELLNDNILLSGGTDGQVTFWNTEVDTIEPWKFHHFKPHKDCVNGVNVHPELPILATCSGQRHCVNFSDSEEDSDETFIPVEDNSIKFWHLRT